VVSHDRHFLDEVATSVWRVGEGTVRVFPGNYSEYLLQREAEISGAPALPPSPGPRLEGASPSTNGKPSPAPSSNGPKSKEQKRREAEERNRLYRALQEGADPNQFSDPVLLRRYVERLESEVAQQEETHAALEAQLSEPSLYAQKEAFAEATRAFNASQVELKTLMKRWERAAARLEVLGA
jgi:ATP-binding cassette, subfamily F, member 3